MGAEIRPNQYANLSPDAICRIFQRSYDSLSSEQIKDERTLMIKSLADSAAKLVRNAPVEQHKDYLETMGAMLTSQCPVPLREAIRSKLYLEIALSLASQTRSE